MPMPDTELQKLRGKKSSVIRFSLCTNDPDNGNDTGRVSAIHVGSALELAWGEIGSEPRYSLIPNKRHAPDCALKLSRKTFPILGSREWEGNWCWTGVAMDEFIAANFLKYIGGDDRWHLEAGWCELSDMFAAQKVTADWLRGHADELESL